MSDIRAFNDSINGNCGVGYIYNLQRKPAKVDRWWYDPDETLDEMYNQGGCDWLLSGFVNEPICMEAYKELVAKHRLVFQSPIRVNKNSGREFFFCIFDVKGTMEYADYDDSEDEQEESF